MGEKLSTQGACQAKEMVDKAKIAIKVIAMRQGRKEANKGALKAPKPKTALAQLSMAIRR